MRRAPGRRCRAGPCAGPGEARPCPPGAAAAGPPHWGVRMEARSARSPPAPPSTHACTRPSAASAPCPPWLRLCGAGRALPAAPGRRRASAAPAEASAMRGTGGGRRGHGQGAAGSPLGGVRFWQRCGDAKLGVCSPAGFLVAPHAQCGGIRLPSPLTRQVSPPKNKPTALQDTQRHKDTASRDVQTGERLRILSFSRQMML